MPGCERASTMLVSDGRLQQQQQHHHRTLAALPVA